MFLDRPYTQTFDDGDVPKQLTLAPIEGFPDYEISNYGEVLSRRVNDDGKALRQSPNNHGDIRVKLIDADGFERTKLVSGLVGNAFRNKPDEQSTTPMLLVPNKRLLCATNIVMRTRAFTAQYNQQFKNPMRLHHSLPVVELTTGLRYESISEASMHWGILPMAIWRSTYSGDRVYPHDTVWEADRTGERV